MDGATQEVSASEREVSAAGEGASAVGESVTADECARTDAQGAWADARADRALAAWEIISLVASTLVAEWVVLALFGSGVALLVPVALAFALIFASMRARGETARDLGLRLDNFARALRLLAPWMLAASAALLVAGWLAGSLNFLRWRGGLQLVGLPTLGVLWGLVQQFALQGFINRRAQILWGRGARSVLLVAAVFALLHFPNPALTAATFAGGLLWAAVYQREPNLYALALSHGLMTWALISSVPPDLLRGLRVGYKFFG